MDNGWRRMTLEDLGLARTRLIVPSDFASEEFELWSVPSFPSGQPETLTGASIGSNKQLVEPGDVLLCKINPRINRVWKVGAKGARRQIASTEWIVLRPSPQVCEPDYLVWALREPSFRQRLAAEVSGVGGSLTRARPAVVKELDVPIAPLNDQRSIVAWIEEMMGRSRRVRGALEPLPTLVEQLSLTVYTLAADGSLISSWRQRKGFHGKRSIDVEPQAKSTGHLPTLPPAWVWASPGQVSAPERNALTIGPFGSNLTKKDYRTSGVPIVFVRQVRSETFLGEGTQFVSPEKAKELSAHRVRSGDLLITKMGDPPGDTAVYPEGVPDGIVTADVIKITPDRNLVDSAYLKYVMRSGVVRTQILQETSGVAHQKVSLARFKNIAIPLPPLEEQREIVSLVDQIMCWIEGATHQVRTAKNELDQWEQAILRTAFRGGSTH